MCDSIGEQHINQLHDVIIESDERIWDLAKWLSLNTMNSQNQL